MIEVVGLRLDCLSLYDWWEYFKICLSGSIVKMG